MPNFKKIHKGLVKMYAEEVLGKRVVVQHLFLSEITWGPDIGVRAAPAGPEDAGRLNEVDRLKGEGTRAPWAR